MAYLLRLILLSMYVAIALTTLSAKGYQVTKFSHIELAIISFIFVIFVQAFVMFYFIGVSRLIENIRISLERSENLEQLFEKAPKDLGPYLKKIKQFSYSGQLSKKQTIPWTGLILVLGMIAFLLGGAHDTGVVDRHVHAGVVYGFLLALTIGFYKQWKYLGKTHKSLRQVKALFSLPDHRM